MYYVLIKKDSLFSSFQIHFQPYYSTEAAGVMVLNDNNLILDATLSHVVIINWGKERSQMGFLKALFVGHFYLISK